MHLDNDYREKYYGFAKKVFTLIAKSSSYLTFYSLIPTYSLD